MRHYDEEQLLVLQLDLCRRCILRHAEDGIVILEHDLE